jgi:CelD/BcsL family acetyltransferase involved in cellulose biosynthesis
MTAPPSATIVAVNAAGTLPRRVPRPVMVAETWEQMRALERGWKQLSAVSQPPNPFLSWEWQRAWVETAVPRARPLIAAEAFADGSLAGLLALQRVRRRGLVQIEFLGQGSDADDLDCLLHPQAPPETAARLLRTATQRGRPDLIHLAGVRPLGAVAHAATAETCAGVHLEGGEWMPYLRLPESFDAFLGAQSANFRAEIRRRRRRLEQAAPEVVLVQATTPQAVSAGMADLFRLHNLRRAQKHSRGLFQAPELRRFHLQAAAALAARGAARLYLLRQHQHAIAALYGLEAGGRFLYFQSGFDPAWTHLSPGTVLLSWAIEDCIRRGLHEFDFLRGKETYKARWTSEGRSGQTLRAACSWRGRTFLRLRDWRQRRAARGTPAGANLQPSGAERDQP